MKNILITSLIFASFSSFASVSDTLFEQKDSKGRKQGFWRNFTYDQNRKKEKLFSLIYFKDGILDSFCYSYYTSTFESKLMQKSFYKNGKKNGEEIVYDTSGNLMVKRNYVNNALNDICINYQQNGFSFIEQNYVNDEVSGEFKKYYYGSNRLHITTNIINGEENGIRKVYSDDAKNELIKEIVLIDGVKIEVRYYKDNQFLGNEKFDFTDEKKRKEEWINKLTSRQRVEYEGTAFWDYE